MTELRATGLVHMDIGHGQSLSKIKLKQEFDWFLTELVMILSYKTVSALCGGHFSLHKTLRCFNKPFVQLNTETTASKSYPIISKINVNRYEFWVHKSHQLIPLAFYCKGSPKEFMTTIFTSKTSEAHNFFYKKVLFACYYCYDIHKATYNNLDEYESHIVNGHRPGTVGYSGFPDIEKFEVKRIIRRQRHSETISNSNN